MKQTSSDEDRVLALMAFAMIEIRMHAHEGNSIACFHLADLFHNVPHRLRTETAGGDILDWLTMRAEQKGMSTWLQNAVHQI